MIVENGMVVGAQDEYDRKEAEAEAYHQRILDMEQLVHDNPPNWANVALEVADPAYQLARVFMWLDRNDYDEAQKIKEDALRAWAKWQVEASE